MGGGGREGHRITSKKRNYAAIAKDEAQEYEDDVAFLRKPPFTNHFSFETIKTGLFIKHDFVECEMRRIKLLNRRAELI